MDNAAKTRVGLPPRLPPPSGGTKLETRAKFTRRSPLGHARGKRLCVRTSSKNKQMRRELHHQAAASQCEETQPSHIETSRAGRQAMDDTRSERECVCVGVRERKELTRYPIWSYEKEEDRSLRINLPKREGNDPFRIMIRRVESRTAPRQIEQSKARNRHEYYSSNGTENTALLMQKQNKTKKPTRSSG